MKKYNLKRFLASLLAVLMLASVTGVSPAVFAEETAAPELVETSNDAPKEVLIKSNFTNEQVLTALANALLTNADAVDAQSLDWTYTCAVKGSYKNAINQTKYTEAREDTFSVLKSHEYVQKDYIYDVTGSGIFRKEWKADVTYVYPALKDNTDGAYTLYLNGQAVYINKVAKLSSSVDFTATDISVPFNNDGSIDYAQLKERILDKVVTNPETAKSNITIEYMAAIDTGKASEIPGIETIADWLAKAGKEWTPIEGGTHKHVFDIPYLAMTAGENTIRLSWGGDDTYYGCTSSEFTVNFLDREPAPLQRNDVSEIGIVYNDDLSVNYEATKEVIRNTLATSTDTEIVDTSDLKVEYQAYNGYNDFSSDANIKPGTEKTIRLSWNGNADYSAWKEEFTVTFVDGRDPAFKLKDGVKDAAPEIGLVFTYDAENGLAIDYVAAETAIREALVTKLGTIDLSDVKVQYKPSIGKVENLDYQPTEILGQDVGKAFGEGEFTIVLTWGGDKGTAQYKPFSEEVKVKMVDNRTPSVVALVDVANITYNMDANVMIEEIIKNAIDSANSTLPADYKASDFTVELKKVTTIGAGDLTTDIVTWVPIAGDDGPNLNAGDNQTIRVTFNGSKDYKPSETAEGTLNVAKANVKVNVKKLITMHAGDADLPEGSITLDPDDRKIDIYTIFAGVTSKIGGKVTTSVYLDLPDSFTNNKALTHVLDPLVKNIIGKSFTEILQEGITVGELRQLAEAATSAAETLKPILKAVGIDVDSFLKVMELINNLPSIADDMVIAIGTPNHAGVYQAFAVTNSINYNTAFGTGTVLVLKNFTGVEIVKSDKLDDGKLTVTEAQAIFDKKDQLCTLQKGDNVLKGAQEALHYRFAGINGGKLYSSHDMPVDPGKYIVTVSVRGGDYYALPTTFTFTIVADETPNA